MQASKSIISFGDHISKFIIRTLGIANGRSSPETGSKRKLTKRVILPKWVAQHLQSCHPELVFSGPCTSKAILIAHLLDLPLAATFLCVLLFSGLLDILQLRLRYLAPDGFPLQRSAK